MGIGYELRAEVPEKLGIPSDGIENFIKEMDGRGIRLHSFMIIRHGMVAAEAYYKPVTADFKHRMYSMTKSFTSLAIGMLIGEGKLSLDSRVADFFPDKLPEDADENIRSATVRDLLMMSSPHRATTYEPGDPDWSRTFFEVPTDHAPGTLFSYDTSGTDVLAALVDRVAGERMLEYMRPRMLDRIGFSQDAWCIKNAEGYTSGGSGLLCTTRDLARVGLLLLDNGEYGGEALIPRDYLKEATSKQIDTNKTGFLTDLCECYGYGYFFWQTRGGSYSMLGMGDQNVTVIPERDMLIVVTADNQHCGTARGVIFDGLWKNIVDRTVEGELPENPEAYGNLKSWYPWLSLPVPEGEWYNPYAIELNGREYAIESDTLDWTRLKFKFAGDRLTLEYATPRGTKEMHFGFGYYRKGKFPETHYNGATFDHPINRELDCYNVAVWTAPRQLYLRSDILDWHLGNLSINIGFKGDVLGIQMFKNAEWFLTEYDGAGSGKLIK